MKVEIRRLLPEDVVAYRQIRLESLKEHPEAFETTYKQALKTETFFFEQPIQQQDKRKFVIGAFDDGVLIGICAFVDDNRYQLEETGSIVQMYVKRSYSGNRIGERLLLKTEADALNVDEISRVMLEVSRDNKRAIQVYQRSGFRKFTENGHLLCMSR